MELGGFFVFLDISDGFLGWGNDEAGLNVLGVLVNFEYI
jgi:hypothetical protein